MADTSLIPLRERVSFGKIPAVVDLPNLIEVQRKSYDRFLQKKHSGRTPRGARLTGSF